MYICIKACRSNIIKKDLIHQTISIYKLEKVCVYVCVWPLLDLAVLVALMLTETRREAILAVWVVLWGSGGKIRCVRPEPRGRRRRSAGAPRTSPTAGRSPAVAAVINWSTRQHRNGISGFLGVLTLPRLAKQIINNVLNILLI